MAEKIVPLKRPRYKMPAFIQDALKERGVVDAYKKRPAYQGNDYIGWITRAKLQATRDETFATRSKCRFRHFDRVAAQMLDELERGDVYMKLKWNPKPPNDLRPRRI